MTRALIQPGFNLLPYRLRKRRETRRRRLAILAAAGVAGWAAVGAVTGWDTWQRSRLDERLMQVEASLRASAAQTGEHARLLRADAERTQARDAARTLAAPRDRFLSLLEALADTPAEPGVALQRVSQRADDVEIAALAPDSQSASRWLKALEHVRDVQSVEVVEMKRRVENVRVAPGAERYEFTALVRYSRDQKLAAAAHRQARAVKGGVQ
jgi:Tfp pilus assembly protein PilN